MKTILPGAAIGVLGGGENSRMLSLAAYRMGYRVHVYSADASSKVPLAEVSTVAPYEELDRVREFATAVDVVTVAEANVPVLALQAAARCSLLQPSAAVFEAVENGVGTKREGSAAAIADFAIIGARGADGQCLFYAPIAIDRVDSSVDIARLPAPIDAKLARQAIMVTRDTLEDLNLTGIACAEFTLTQAQELLLHDVTPYPHASGNVTVDACVTSQFEQQIRAVCGLPLGSTDTLRSAAMARLDESIWSSGQPDWASALTFSGVKLHLYGNLGGHITATAASATLARQIVRASRAALTRG